MKKQNKILDTIAYPLVSVYSVTIANMPNAHLVSKCQALVNEIPAQHWEAGVGLYRSLGAGGGRAPKLPKREHE